MRTSLRTLGASVVAIAALALVPTVSLAAELRGGSQTSVASSEVVTNDLYIAGGSVMSSGAIRGGMNAAGGTVLVTSPVSQDVTVAGGTLTILGAVGGSVRALGGNITVGGAIHNDVVVAGGQIQITGSGVGRDVVAAGGTVNIDAPVKGNVRFAGGELYINAPISGNVNADGKKITLGKDAVISGNFTYKATQEVVMETGAQVRGTVSYTPRMLQSDAVKKGFAAFVTFWLVAKFLMMLAGALVLGLLLRRYSGTIVERAFVAPLAELGRGLVALIVLPVVSVLLLVTVIGIPFGVLGLLSFIALIIVASLIAPILLGSLLYKWLMKGATYEVSWKTIVLGVLAYAICGLIPFLGWVVILIFWLMALGALVKTKLDILQGWR